MTSIYDIPYEDISIFLKVNNPRYDFDDKDKDTAYTIALTLLKDKNSKGHTTSIVEWMIAHNLLKTKVDIPNYTIYEIDKLSQNQIDKLSKLLTMNGNNIENIKNILRYLHKLDETINISNNENLTIAGEAIYNIILSNMSNKTLNQMGINKYSKLYLEDSQFWKNRLAEIFDLKTNDDNFDYKFTVKFLDNGKSLDENYSEAIDKRLKPIIKLLLDNDVVKSIEPSNLLQNINTTLPDLAEIKNLPYNDFIKEIVYRSNEILDVDDVDEQSINNNYFDKIEFTGKKFTVIIDIEDPQDIYKQIKTTFSSEGGLTNGEILYNIAQLIPNNNEIRNIMLKYIKDNSIEILNQIEENRNTLKNLAYYNEISKDFLKNLIKSPKKFLEFMNNNSKNMINSLLKPKYITDETERYYPFLPDYTDYFGNHIYWEGLRKWEDEDEYILILGS